MQWHTYVAIGQVAVDISEWISRFRCKNMMAEGLSVSVRCACLPWHKLSMPARVKQYFRNAAKNLEFHVKPWSGSTSWRIFSAEGSSLFRSWHDLGCSALCCDYANTEARTGGGICWPGFCISFSGTFDSEGHFGWFLEISKLMSLAKLVKSQQNNGNQPYQTQHEDDDLRKTLTHEARL